MGHGPLRTHLMTRKHIVIEGRKCVGCQLCMRNCPVGTVIAYSEKVRIAFVKNSLACGGCGACLRGCAAGAVHIKEERLTSSMMRVPDRISAPGQAVGQPTSHVGCAPGSQGR